ncbi:MAG: hypothetical protein KA228_10940, partial [Flavobacterium sp.]|nr:hypothetical protein [Flavobacterium sp.]
MIKKTLTILLIFFLIIACKENLSEIKPNETIEYYPKNSKVIFKKTIHLPDFDSVFYFYDNGILFKKGKQYK